MGTAATSGVLTIDVYDVWTNERYCRDGSWKRSERMKRTAEVHLDGLFGDMIDAEHRRREKLAGRSLFLEDVIKALLEEGLSAAIKTAAQPQPYSIENDCG